MLGLAQALRLLVVAEYLQRFPKDRYRTEVERWRELQSQSIEFTLKRLREPEWPLVRGFAIVLPCSLGFGLGVEGFLIAMGAPAQQAQPSLSDP
jgi:hypothetical protein